MATYDQLLTTYSRIVLELLPPDTQIKYNENTLLTKIKNALKIVICEGIVIGPDYIKNTFNHLIISELDSDDQQLPENRDNLLNSYIQTIRKLASLDQNSLLDSDIAESIESVTRQYHDNPQHPDSSIRTQILNSLTAKAQARAINAARAQAALVAVNRARAIGRLFPRHCVSQQKPNKKHKGGRRSSKKHPTARRRRSSKDRKSRKVRKSRSTRRR